MGQEIFETVWASNADPGDIADPGTVKMNLGWEDEIPKLEHFNWKDRRIERQIQYAQASGVDEYHALIVYRDKALAMGSDGIVYQAQSGAVTGNNPVGDDGSNWLPYTGPRGTQAAVLGGLTHAKTNTFEVTSQPGFASDDENLSTREFTAGQVKRLDTNWTQGGVGGKASVIGALSASRWYPYFVGWDDAGNETFGWDKRENRVSAAGLKADTGYPYWRRIGNHRTDFTGSFIEDYRQTPENPELIEWEAGAESGVVINNDGTTDEFLVGLFYAPPDSTMILSVILDTQAYQDPGGTNRICNIRPESATSPIGAIFDDSLFWYNGNDDHILNEQSKTAIMEIESGIQAAVKVQFSHVSASPAGPRLLITVRGWKDRRGRMGLPVVP